MAESEEVQSAPINPPGDSPNWRLRIGFAIAFVVFLVLVYIVGSTLVPRWWAHRVGDRVDGRITTGTFYGLFTGFVFTFVPLVILRQIFRGVSGKVRLGIGVLAVLVAAPNLMTLSIVLGSGNGAHAGDRTLDIAGPGFRAGSAWGAAIAVVLAIALFAWLWKWRHDRKAIKDLKEEVKTHREAAAKPVD